MTLAEEPAVTPAGSEGTSETTGQRGETSAGPGPSPSLAFVTQEILQSPQQASPSERERESSKHISLACPMLLLPLGGACHPRLQRERVSWFQHIRYQKNKKEKEKSGSSVTVDVVVIYRQI